jgi:hypothetical protein
MSAATIAALKLSVGLTRISRKQQAHRNFESA